DDLLDPGDVGQDGVARDVEREEGSGQVAEQPSVVDGDPVRGRDFRGEPLPPVEDGVDDLAIATARQVVDDGLHRLPVVERVQGMVRLLLVSPAHGVPGPLDLAHYKLARRRLPGAGDLFEQDQFRGMYGRSDAFSVLVSQDYPAFSEQPLR